MQKIKNWVSAQKGMEGVTLTVAVRYIIGDPSEKMRTHRPSTQLKFVPFAHAT
jgi:hypothetical protein